MKCEVPNCRRDAVRVIRGHQLCRLHREGHLVAAEPLRRCAIAECHQPVPNPSQTLCRGHNVPGNESWPRRVTVKRERK
jgi:hypothetical protein